MNKLMDFLSAQSGNGHLVLRLVAGVIVAYAGYNKVFVNGLGKMQVVFEKMGVILPQVSGPFISLLELIGGLMIIAGLFTRQVALLLMCDFIYATFWQWSVKGNFTAGRLELLLIVVFIMLATSGSGPLSIDRSILKKK